MSVVCVYKEVCKMRVCMRTDLCTVFLQKCEWHLNWFRKKKKTWAPDLSKITESGLFAISIIALNRLTATYVYGQWAVAQEMLYIATLLVNMLFIEWTDNKMEWGYKAASPEYTLHFHLPTCLYPQKFYTSGFCKKSLDKNKILEGGKEEIVVSSSHHQKNP